ncbi:unnamed protein product [Orchesella dallaii]|uniref:Uncharacterized protein n=1 Tax=Orchesella dallaii TaxID=48710 RepID=A0ABP1R7N5_9HEXA
MTRKPCATGLLNGVWRMPYDSRNWIEEINMTVYNRALKESQIVSIYPRVTLSHNKGHNTTWTLLWKCPKPKGEFELRCCGPKAIRQCPILCVGRTKKNKVPTCTQSTPDLISGRAYTFHITPADNEEKL